jgi:hypothetical protein
MGSCDLVDTFWVVGEMPDSGVLSFIFALSFPLDMETDFVAISDGLGNRFNHVLFPSVNVYRSCGVFELFLTLRWRVIGREFDMEDSCGGSSS